MKYLIIYAFLFVIYLNSSVAFACFCPAEKPCVYMAGADAVFIGTAIKTQLVVSENIFAPNAVSTSVISNERQKTRFKVEKSFIGVTEQEIEVSGGGTTCDFDFTEGGHYLVFASRGADGKTLFTSFCMGTSLISEAKTSLSYLQKNLQNNIGASFNGTVERIVFDEKKDSWERKPISNSKIVLESEKSKWQVVTNKQGRFSLQGIPQGKYKVRTHPTVNTSQLWFTTYDAKDEPRNEWDVEIPSQGCINTWFAAQPVGEISGQVTGKFSDCCALEIIFADRKATEDNELGSAVIDKDGRFKFNFLPKGKFYIGLHLKDGPSLTYPYPEYYYPGVTDRKKATPISLKEGQKISGLTFQYPSPVERRIISGVAVWKNGKPAIDVEIKLYNARTNLQEGDSITTDNKGHFSIVGMEGQKYKLSAKVFLRKKYSMVNSKSMIVKVEKENKPVKLVIELP